jgi:hypothetical protein
LKSKKKSIFAANKNKMNKKSILLITLACCLLCLNLHADGDEKKNVIKWNPMEYILPHTITLSYERVLQDNMSLNTNLSFNSVSVGGATNGVNASEYYTIFGITPELRFYVKHDAPRRFYVGPYLTYKQVNYGGDVNDGLGNSGSISGRFNIIGGGAMLGYQWLIGGAFALDINTGFGYYHLSSGDIKYNYNNGTVQTYPIGLSLSGVLPIFGLSLGYAF